MQRYNGGSFWESEEMISITVRVPVSQVDFIKSICPGKSLSYSLRTLIHECQDKRKTNNPGKM